VADRVHGEQGEDEEGAGEEEVQGEEGAGVQGSSVEEPQAADVQGRGDGWEDERRGRAGAGQ
jgi:hypothetical protein